MRESASRPRIMDTVSFIHMSERGTSVPHRRWNSRQGYNPRSDGDGGSQELYTAHQEAYVVNVV
ncbi:hypothetical protein DOTSEDRAFT_67907 [Dothistroma septosporum NZE10]|uniref:Uncharacterized protein n=1 Tax=Dothistroma septosporum (strain NZE10 / CBS 128990) TaxID=675120 RepID=N1Q182_DOTSN|nr:hypothetical protein DOTSEDRAFT_67907 [Dothistroma septosporum NZE10]